MERDMSFGKAYLSSQRLGCFCVEFMNEATDLFSVLGTCKSWGLSLKTASKVFGSESTSQGRRSWLSSTSRGRMGSYEPAPKAGPPGAPICELTKENESR